MTQLEEQYHEWSHAKLELHTIFSRLRPFNLKEQCFRLFELNVLSIYPLISVFCLEANDPCLAANVIAVLNSELPDIGQNVIRQLLSHAKSQVKEFGGDFSQTQSILIAGHLFRLKAANAYPIFQLFICLTRAKQWKLADTLLRIAGPDLRVASPRSHEYIQTKVSPGKLDLPQLEDIVLDEFKKEHEFDISELEWQYPAFEVDDEWRKKSQVYENMRDFILDNEETDDESETESAEESADSSPASNEPSDATTSTGTTIDTTNRQIVALRKTIYLTIMSTVSTQEACHKLLSLGHRDQVVKILLESGKQEKMYNRSFGSICHHLSRVGNQWQICFEQEFHNVYNSSETMTTKELRNLGTLYGYLLATDSIGWTVFEVVNLDPQNSNVSNRILLQAIFEELRREIGVKGIHTRFSTLPSEATSGILPHKGELESLDFSINFFTAINMGALVDNLRQERRKRKAVRN